MGEDEDNDFLRDSTTDDNRVRTAAAWLEEAVLLTREENRVTGISVLPHGEFGKGCARQARKSHDIREDYRRQLLTITRTLIEADPDEGISTDELMSVSGLSSEGVRNALHDLERHGYCQKRYRSDRLRPCGRAEWLATALSRRRPRWK